MNSKGQMFSLDLIIAIALVILAIGLLYKQAELFQYFSKDDSLQAELYRIGYSASNQLVSNPEIVCKLKDSTGALILDYLPNCLPTGDKQNNINKESLGIPSGFKCKLVNSASNVIGLSDSAGCNDAVPAATRPVSIFSIERKVVFLRASNADSISKSSFENCVKGSCSLSTGLIEDTVKLRVWKE